MIVANKSSSAASALDKFFDDLRRADQNSAAELSGFFQRFEDDYRQARSKRAATTPHLDLLRVFGLEFAELRHSAALAWFLNPLAEHEQGSLFVNALLDWCHTSPTLSENYVVLCERHQRTDVAVYADGEFAVFIENKVRHVEREKQVSDMVDSMTRVSQPRSIPPERRFAIFLTDTGVAPVTGPTADSPDFLHVNLKSARRVELFECFRAALAERPGHSPLLLNFIDSYLRAIRRLRASL